MNTELFVTVSALFAISLVLLAIAYVIDSSRVKCLLFGLSAISAIAALNTVGVLHVF
jgi:hypothetical protein